MKDGLEIAADLEMTPGLTLNEAHEISDKIEKEIKESIPKVKSVTLHMETALVEGNATDITLQSQDLVDRVHKIVAEVAPNVTCSGVVVRKEKNGVSLLVGCGVDGSMPLATSHDISDSIEKKIMESFPEIICAFIHIEPI
jgi:divalent metal cation (Fe/Co/Zn/Cd) transporter